MGHRPPATSRASHSQPPDSSTHVWHPPVQHERISASEAEAEHRCLHTPCTAASSSKQPWQALCSRTHVYTVRTSTLRYSKPQFEGAARHNFQARGMASAGAERALPPRPSSDAVTRARMHCRVVTSLACRQLSVQHAAHMGITERCNRLATAHGHTAHATSGHRARHHECTLHNTSFCMHVCKMRMSFSQMLQTENREPPCSMAATQANTRCRTRSHASKSLTYPCPLLGC